MTDTDIWSEPRRRVVEWHTTGAGELTAHGWVTKPGRRVAFAEGDVRDAAGKLVATATSSLLVMVPG